jgi:hypothetical protein
VEVSVIDGDAVLVGLSVMVGLLVGETVSLAGGEAVKDRVTVGELVIV